jgi:hypothetical protein
MGVDPSLPARGIQKYQRYLGRRYPTFFCAFEKFVGIGGRTIVELGTSRSFVSGGREGCMMNDARYWTPDQPDNWDWGAGLFTRMCAEQLQGCRPQIHTVDISRDALEISRVITADFAGMIHYHLTSSEDFLQSFQGPIDLLYMDAGETGAGADQLHWREARIALARQLFSPQAIVLIDDVNVPGVAASKGRYSIPLLCQHGFQIIMSDYQVLLQRTDQSISSLSYVIGVGM